MEQDRDQPDEWIAPAVAQARALRETVRDHPRLCELVDVVLIELAVELARRSLPRAP